MLVSFLRCVTDREQLSRPLLWRFQQIPESEFKMRNHVSSVNKNSAALSSLTMYQTLVFAENFFAQHNGELGKVRLKMLTLVLIKLI